MARDPMFDPSRRDILEDMYGSEAEFLQDQKEAEAEHHASLTGACRETFGADADRLGKPKRRGWRPRVQQDERAPGTPPSAQEVYDTVQRRRAQRAAGRSGAISFQAGAIILGVCTALAVLVFAVSVYILEDKPLVSAFPGEYARAADEYNSRYEFARTGEFARENGLDDLYGHEDADYAPAVAEALAEQEISNVLDGYQRMYRLLIEGDLTGAQNEADTLAYDLTRLCQPQDYMPGASESVCARGMELARTILLNEGDDGTLYAALTGDDISAVYEAEDAVRAMLSASIYEQDAAQSEAAPAQGETAEAADGQAPAEESESAPAQPESAAPAAGSDVTAQEMLDTMSAMLEGGGAA